MKHTHEACGVADWSSLQVSDEAERSVLVKLKTECGYQFTSKLESMFTDIKTSRDTMQEYKARRQASANGEDDVELAVQVWHCTVNLVFSPPNVQKRLVSGGGSSRFKAAV